MNKATLIKDLAAAQGTTQVAAGKTVELVIGLLTAELVAGVEVNLSGFGKLVPVTRTGSTKITGEEVAYSVKSVKFRPSADLKRAVNA